MLSSADIWEDQISAYLCFDVKKILCKIIARGGSH